MQEYWTEERDGALEINPDADATRIRINICADHVVEVDKLYGPWSVSPIRCRLERDTAEWVIEQEHIRTLECGGSELYWVEMARFLADADSALMETM